MPSNELETGLTMLDEWLGSQNRRLELIIVGAYALRLLQVSHRHTIDIDSISIVEDQEILQEIQKIGKLIGSEDWLNFRASTIPMPEGFKKRLQAGPKFQNLRLLIPAKSDLILTKISAYFIRKDLDPKDLEDLVQIGIKQSDIQAGMAFIRRTNSPPPNYKKGQKDFEASLKELEKELEAIAKK